MKVAVVWARTDPDMRIWRALLLLYAQWALESAMFGRFSEKFRIFCKHYPSRCACRQRLQYLVPTPPSLPAFVKPPAHSQHWVSQISYLPDLRLLSIGTHTFFGVSENTSGGSFLACLTIREGDSDLPDAKPNSIGCLGAASVRRMCFWWCYRRRVRCSSYRLCWTSALHLNKTHTMFALLVRCSAG